MVADRAGTATRSSTSDPLFIDLVALDALERMRLAGTIAQFGIEASPEIRDLMESGNIEKRKVAVAILKEASLHDGNAPGRLPDLD